MERAKELRKELPPIEDARVQIMKAFESLEHTSTFKGETILEAGEYDSMCSIIDEALAQAEERGRRQVLEAAEEMIDKGDYSGTKWPKETQAEVDGWNEALIDLLARFGPLKDSNGK